MIWESKSHMSIKVLRLTGIVFLGTVAGKTLGFLREMFIAALYGASHNTDAYLVAFTVPTLISAGLSAALTTVAVTLFADNRQTGIREKSGTFFSSLNNIVLVFGTAVSLLCVAIAPLIIRILAPGFQGDALSTTTFLARIMIPMSTFLLLAGLYSGVLNAEGNFSAPALKSISYNLCIIAFIVVAGQHLGIEALAIGTMIGGISQAIIQIPALFKKGYRFKPVIRIDSGILTAIRMLLPILIGVAVSQVNQIIDRMFASTLTEGSIAALSFGYRIFDLPGGLFINSILTVAYPSLVRTTTSEQGDFRKAMSRSISIISFVATPLAISMITLREPLVRAIYMRGAFEESAVGTTAIALAFYAVGFLPLAINDMLKRGFWANKDTKTPVLVSIGAVLFNILFNALLIGRMGHGGLALGTSLSMLLATVLLGEIAHRKEYFSWTELQVSLFKTIVAGGVMGVGMALMLWLVDSIIPLHAAGFLLNILSLVIIGAIGLGIYYFTSRLLKTEAVRYFHNNVIDPFRIKLRQLVSHRQSNT